MIGGEVETCLDQWVIEHAVLLATRHKGKPGQIHKHGSGPILAVESEQRALRWELIRGEIATNGCQSLAQFLPVASVPPVAKRAEPLVTVGLTDRCTRSDHLPPLAPPVTGSTDLI